MKTIIYTCPYVPAEWIAAHGLSPRRIIPIEAGLTGTLSRAEGVCPFVQGFINLVLTDKQFDGVVITTLCDQMRRAYDILLGKSDVPLFLMNELQLLKPSIYYSFSWHPDSGFLSER